LDILLVKDGSREIDSLKEHRWLRFVLVKIDGGEQTAIAMKIKVLGHPLTTVYKNGKAV
jgi:thioredoxin-like negative regulator of GroEL